MRRTRFIAAPFVTCGRTFLAACAAHAGLLLVLACESVDNEPEPSKAAPKEALFLGLVPEQNIFEQKERYDRLLKATGRKLRWRLGSHIFQSYGDVLDAFRKKRVAGAFLGSYSAVAVQEAAHADLLVTQVGGDGRAFYRGLIIARSDSGITDDVASWRGKCLAMVHPHTSAGYLFPISVLAEAGVEDAAGFLGQMRFLGSHDAVVHAVWDGVADIGALKDTMFEKVIAGRQELKEGITILRTSAEFPDISLVMRSGLPADMLSEVKAAFLSLHESKAGRQALHGAGLTRYIWALPERYGNVRKLMPYHFRGPSLEPLRMPQ